MLNCNRLATFSASFVSHLRTADDLLVVRQFPCFSQVVGQVGVVPRLALEHDARGLHTHPLPVPEQPQWQAGHHRAVVVLGSELLRVLPGQCDSTRGGDVLVRVFLRLEAGHHAHVGWWDRLTLPRPVPLVHLVDLSCVSHAAPFPPPRIWLPVRGSPSWEPSPPGDQRPLPC